MKWFIGCLILIFVGTTILIVMWFGIIFHVVDTKIEDDQRMNLIILYDVR